MSNARTLASLIDDTNTRIKIPSGYGLDFADYGAEDSNSATTVGSNLMDDYESGSFTPTFNNFNVGDGSVFGTYTKIGNTVHTWYGFVFGSSSSLGGAIASITGLPFTLLSRTGDVYVKSNGVCWDSGNTWTSVMAMSQDSTNTAVYPMRTSNSAVISGTVPFTWASGDSLTFQLTYEVA